MTIVEQIVGWLNYSLAFYRKWLKSILAFTGGQAHNNLQPYEDEQAKLRERNGELMVLITAEQEASDGVSQFVSLVRQFTDIPSLTPEIVAAFIEKVYVHDAVVVNRKKQQEIRVVYNFVGDMK